MFSRYIQSIISWFQLYKLLLRLLREKGGHLDISAYKLFKVHVHVLFYFSLTRTKLQI